MIIKVDSSIRADLSDNEYKYLRLLEFHTAFVRGVKTIRKKLKIRVEGDAEAIISFNTQNKGRLKKMVFELTSKLVIPHEFDKSVQSIVKCGRVLVATKPIYVLNPENQLSRSLLFNKKIWPRQEIDLNNLNRESEYDKSWYVHNQSLVKKYGTSPFIPVILIVKSITRKELHMAIDSEWKNNIAPAKEDYKKSLPCPLEISNVPVYEIEEYIKLLRLRRRGKKHREIGEMMKIEPDSVREKFVKIKKFLENIGFPSLKM